ncbi:MAG: NCS2 family permease [Phascolarctobacterium sp.]|nr:NCS2 family permease [Phascolarctobacterium sp.]MBR6636484.1 NCS2 family permease [Phascolarctobacterium sp.]
MNSLCEKFFKLREHGTNVKTEFLAGVTTFMTMAYILAVNPLILSAAGMDSGAVFVATALSACLGTLIMAFCSNYPFVLAPGMGLNAFFAYTVVGQMGYSWQVALGAVFLEGILFLILSLTNVREAIFNCIPPALKFGVSGGIGLFITFIGLQSAKLVVDGPTLVSLYPFKAAIANGEFFSTGIGAVLAILGVLFTAVLLAKKVPGAILWGIVATWFAGMGCEVIGVYVPNPHLGMFSVMPDFSRGLSVPSLAPTIMQMDFSGIFTFNFVTIMLSFMFVDLFDTLGTLIGVASKANMLDRYGRLPKIRGALLADSIATAGGAMLGTSTVTTFVESSAGVAVGGRTGLTGVVSAGFFAISLLLSPIFLAIPAFATAPALITVGFMMLTSIMNIDFTDFSEAIPAFLAIIAMPFTYSISEGIALGVISYVLIHLTSGNYRFKNIGGIIYILAVLFVLKYIFV